MTETAMTETAMTTTTERPGASGINGATKPKEFTRK
jgi:hypothetical protein